METQDRFVARAHVQPAVTRSRVVLEIASELVAAADQPLRQARVWLRDQRQPEWPLCLFGSDSIQAIYEVVNREADLAIVNPAGPLTLAYRGTGRFEQPQPVRTIAVIPSLDQLVFAVKSETRLRSFEEICARRYPLKIALRGQLDHSVHAVLDDVVAAAGFSLDDLRSWGGHVLRQGELPFPDGPKFHALRRGEIDAIFDEAAPVWVEAALGAGMTILSLGEQTIRRLEVLGYRRGLVAKRRYPDLSADVLTVDFSGWPIFVHAELADDYVTKICAALDARKHLIPWEESGPLPVERMCHDAPSTPLDVPLHPAAERFWSQRGYL